MTKSRILLKLAGIAIVAVTMLGGCSNVASVATIEPQERYVVNEQIKVASSQTAAGRFNSQMIFMADQIERNVDRKSLENTFIVTSFTNLNKLSETTPFGRLVAENLIHELQVRKWKVFEVRLTRDVIINETGEFSLSRDIQKLKSMYKVGGIVTGTYSVVNGHVIVNARVIDIDSGLVASSAQAHMPTNWFTESLLFNDDNLRSMRIVGDTPFSCRNNPVCWNQNSSNLVNTEAVKR